MNGWFAYYEMSMWMGEGVGRYGGAVSRTWLLLLLPLLWVGVNGFWARNMTPPLYFL